MQMERRAVPTEFEVRSEGGNFNFYGYALKWDARSSNLGGFRERVAEGATTDSITRDDIRALFNHDPNLILGRNRSGTLRLSEDSTGLHYAVDMPDTTYARDLATAMERGDVTQSSFGFKTSGPEGDSWAEDEDGFPLRTLQKVALFDVSPVTYPAYTDSTSGVGTRALELLAEGFPVLARLLHHVAQRQHYALFHAFQTTDVDVRVVITEQLHQIDGAFANHVLHITLGLAGDA